MRVLVIGGTLFIGRLLVEELVRAGHTVTVLHRNRSTALPDGVTGLIADRNDPSAVRSALAGSRFDAVFDNVYDFKRGTTAEHVEAAARACANPGLQRYVFMSSVAAFPPGLDYLDSDPLVPRGDPNSYARNKANSERVLFAMHERNGFPAVAIRPPFVYGPMNSFYREAFFWDRLRDGRPIIVPGDGTRLMQFAFVGDIIRCCMRILERPAAVGHAFNVGDRPPVTQLEAVQAFARAAGREPNIVFVPREKALAAGGDLMGPKLYFAEYYDLPPITMLTVNMNDRLGIQATPFEEGLRGTFEWWARHNPFPTPDYAFEDQILRVLRC
jgi:nucleoside-diphosphate-sugar epimerase